MFNMLLFSFSASNKAQDQMCFIAVDARYEVLQCLCVCSALVPRIRRDVLGSTRLYPAFTHTNLTALFKPDCGQSSLVSLMKPIGSEAKWWWTDDANEPSPTNVTDNTLYNCFFLFLVLETSPVPTLYFSAGYILPHFISNRCQYFWVHFSQYLIYILSVYWSFKQWEFWVNLKSESS